MIDRLARALEREGALAVERDVLRGAGELAVVLERLHRKGAGRVVQVAAEQHQGRRVRGGGRDEDVVRTLRLREAAVRIVGARLRLEVRGEHDGGARPEREMDLRELPREIERAGRRGDRLGPVLLDRAELASGEQRDVHADRAARLCDVVDRVGEACLLELRRDGVEAGLVLHFLERDHVRLERCEAGRELRRSRVELGPGRHQLVIAGAVAGVALRVEEVPDVQLGEAEDPFPSRGRGVAPAARLGGLGAAVRRPAGVLWVRGVRGVRLWIRGRAGRRGDRRGERPRRLVVTCRDRENDEPGQKRSLHNRSVPLSGRTLQRRARAREMR